MPKYKIVYDRRNCIGVSSCALLAEEFWKMNADDKADLVGGKEKADGSWERQIDEKDLHKNKEAEAAVAECTKARIKLAVMLQRRFFHNTAALKKIVESRALGEITKVHYELNVNKTKEYYQGWRGKKELVGGGVLLCQGLHDIDRIAHCFGQPEIISSKIRTTRNYIDIEDEAEIMLQLPNNIPWKITASANSPTVWSGKILVVGSKGSVLLDSEKVLEWKVPGVAMPAINQKVDRDFVPVYYDPCHEEVIEDFIQSIMQDKEPIINGESTLPALKTLFEIYEKSIP